MRAKHVAQQSSACWPKHTQQGLMWHAGRPGKLLLSRQLLLPNPSVGCSLPRTATRATVFVPGTTRTTCRAAGQQSPPCQASGAGHAGLMLWQSSRRARNVH